MGTYDRQIATATKLIKAKGQIVTWRKFTKTDNINQPWKATQTQQDYQVSVLFTKEMISLVKGTDVTESIPDAMMASVSFTPEMNDLIIRGNDIFVIRSAEPFAPNGIPIFYNLSFINA